GNPTDPTGTATHIEAQRDVVIASTSTAQVTNYVDTRAGAVIKAEIAKGKSTLTNTSQATVGNGVAISAGRDFQLTATSENNATIQVISKGGGAISHAEGQSSEKLTFQTHARIGDGATITAGGELAARSDVKIDAL